MDKARQETDKRLAEMEKHLAGIYERANKEVGEKWKAYMDKAAEKIKPFEQAVEAAKKSGDAEALKKAEKALTAKQKEITILDAHYRNLTKQTAAELSNVNKTAVAYINDQIPKIYEINYNGIGKDVENAVKGYSFELVDAHTVKELVTKDNSLLPQPKINIAKDVRWNTQTINSEVLQGIIQGESIPTIAKRFRNVTTMNRASALRNARTAVTGAENRGRLDMLRNAKDKGINANKVWMATGDNRTRDAHAELDGEEAKIEEPFVNEFGEIMFPGDPGADAANVYNCRCTLTYNILGFGVADQQEAQMFTTPIAEDITSANEYGTQTLGKIYDQHNASNGLHRVGFADANKLSQTVGANYSNLSLETANVFNQQIAALASQYDTPLQKVRTMTKQEAALSRNTFARVNHNYAVDAAEMVINPVKCGTLSDLTERIVALQEKGYCVKIKPGREADYVVTHEFGHSIVDMKNPISQNFVDANFDAVKAARNEIGAIYEEYIAEVSKKESAFKQAELDFILGNGTRESALELQAKLNDVKLSNYSMSNADEFLAEAFVNQKIGAVPNQYAERAVAVLDKHFGR